MSSKPSWLTRYWPFGLGVLFTLGVASLTWRQFAWRAVWASLAKADLRYVALALAAMLLNIVLKTWRWRWLFHPQSEHLRCGDLLSALMIGQLGNVLLPTRLGDVARLGVVHRKSGVALSWALLTIVAEKALDSVMLLVLLAALLPFVTLPAWLGTSQLILGAALAAGFMGVAAHEKGRRRVAQALQRLLGRRIARWAESALDSISAWRALQESQVRVWLWTLSVAIWLLAGLVNYFGFRAVALGLPFSAGLLLAVTEIAGTELAYTPAAVGVYHSIAILTLATFGVGPADALSAAFLLYLVVYLPILLGGLTAAWSEGLTLGQPQATGSLPPGEDRH
jgi:uncharacterized protein (TIRG00374 family)